jgi:hypothetical protein
MIGGLLFPSSVLSEHWFGILSAFVSLNTVMYVALAMLKILPVIRPGHLMPRRRYVRAQTRSIYPDAQENGLRGTPTPMAGRHGFSTGTDTEV